MGDIPFRKKKKQQREREREKDLLRQKKNKVGYHEIKMIG